MARDFIQSVQIQKIFRTVWKYKMKYGSKTLRLHVLRMLAHAFNLDLMKQLYTTKTSVLLKTNLWRINDCVICQTLPVPESLILNIVFYNHSLASAK